MAPSWSPFELRGRGRIGEQDFQRNRAAQAVVSGDVYRAHAAAAELALAREVGIAGGLEDRDVAVGRALLDMRRRGVATADGRAGIDQPLRYRGVERPVRGAIHLDEIRGGTRR